MSKSLGQVFHEAFIARLHAREPMIGNQIVTFGSWGECDETYKADTESAAQAVERRVREVPCGIECGLSRAVIEAAEALIEGPWSANNPVFWDNFRALIEAVRALQEARDEQ